MYYERKSPGSAAVFVVLLQGSRFDSLEDGRLRKLFVPTKGEHVACGQPVVRLLIPVQPLGQASIKHHNVGRVFRVVVHHEMTVALRIHYNCLPSRGQTGGVWLLAAKALAVKSSDRWRDIHSNLALKKHVVCCCELADCYVLELPQPGEGRGRRHKADCCVYNLIVILSCVELSGKLFHFFNYKCGN